MSKIKVGVVFKLDEQGYAGTSGTFSSAHYHSSCHSFHSSGSGSHIHIHIH